MELYLLPILVVASSTTSFVDYTDLFDLLGSWSTQSIPCGLPTFSNILPIDVQQAVKEVWANYSFGNGCVEEYLATRRLLELLDEDIRDKVFADRCGPLFLHNISRTIRNEFHNVWFSLHIPLENRELRMKQLAYSLLNADQLALFNRWEAEIRLRREEFARKANRLSAAGGEALETWRAIKLQERDFLANLSKPIQEELKTLYNHRGWRKVTATESDENRSRQRNRRHNNEEEDVHLTLNAQHSYRALPYDTDHQSTLLIDVSTIEQLINQAECDAYY